MAITTREQLATAYKNPYVCHYFKYSSGTLPLTSWSRLDGFVQNGTPDVGGGSGGFSVTSTGAIPLPTPATGNTWYLTEFQAVGSNEATAYWLYDRYCGSAVISGNAGANTLTSCTLPARVTDQTGGHQVWLNSLSTSGPSATASIQYTNSAGSASRTGTLVSGIPSATSGIAGQLFGPFLLQSGDLGVRSVQSVSFSAAPGGNLQIIMAKPLAAVFGSGNMREGPRLGWSELGLVDVGTNPCLFLMGAASSSLPYMSAVLTFVQG